MTSLPESIFQRVYESYGVTFSRISKISSEKLARDVLSEQKIRDQINIFLKHSGMSAADLVGKKVLEIGSGMGIFISVTRKEFGMESYGIEPSEEGFNTSFDISHDVLKFHGLDPNIITDAKGEQLPFSDNSFDIIFSSTVIEHVDNPFQVLKESLRVLKPGGFLHFVYPNHHSFFDGHYCIFHPPMLFNGALFPWMVKYIYQRDPAFAKTLRTELNVWSTKRMLRKLNKLYRFEKVSLGEDIFRDRMKTLTFGEYGGLGKIKKLLTLSKKLGLIAFMTSILLALKLYDPIILTIRKNKSN